MTAVAALSAGVWTLQSTLSSAGFAARHFGGSGTVHGQIPIREAWVRVDRYGNPAAIGAVLDLAALDTGNARRDADLRKPRLLDTGRCPTLTFDATGIEPGDGGWSVTGTLAGCGHRTAITLATTVTPGDAGTMTAHATAEFDRRELGITAPRFLIGTRIAVTIDAVFAPPA